MNEDLFHAFVQVSGGINAFLLGFILIFSRRARRTRAAGKLGCAFLAYGYLLLSFTAIDNLWIPVYRWALYIEYFLVLTASALFLDYVHEVMTQKPVSRLSYLPAPIFVAVTMIMPPGFVPQIALNCVIGIQLIYTVITTAVYFHEKHRLARNPRHLKLLLTGLWALHFFQAARMVFPGNAVLFDLVPLVGAVLMVILTAFVLTESGAMQPFARVMESIEDSTTAVEAVDQYMRRERPFLDPGLTLEQLAVALGMARGELSRLIGTTREGTFYDFVNHYRVLQAKEFLADPAEARTSIEAIGLMAGFKARSTFYEYFRRHTGMTPAQYRSSIKTND